MAYDGLLRLCGFEPEVIEQDRPRIEKAFEKLEFNSEDIGNGEERVRQYFDTESIGIRKMLGLWIQCLFDLVLAGEEREKIIYCSMPPFSQVMNAMAMVSEDIFVCPADIVLNHTLGGIFGKQDPILEAAEGDLIPAGANFCGGIQAKLGALNKGMIPIPDLLVSTGFVCDQTPKVDELIGQRYGVPVAYVDGIHDEWEGSWPRISDRRLKYLVHEAKDALNKFEEVTGYAVTEELAKRANLREIDLAGRCNQMINLLRHADPVPMSYADIGATARLIIGVNTTTLYKNMEGLADLVCKELKKKINKGEGILPKGTPKVGIHILWCDPAPIKMIEQAGLAVTMDLTNGLISTELERDLVDREDFWESSAGLVLHFGGIKYAKRMIRVCIESGLDGVILNYPVGCRNLCIGAIEDKKLLTQELGIPVLLLESNHADTRNYSAEAMRSRVEAYAEILTADKAAAGY